VDDKRIVGWKSISEYLDVSVRTAGRWHGQRGLPVHHAGPGSKSSAVWAYAAELDRWLRSSDGEDALHEQAGDTDSPADDVGDDRASEADAPGLPTSPSGSRRVPVRHLLGVAAIALMAWAAFGVSRARREPATPTHGPATAAMGEGVHAWGTPTGRPNAILEIRLGDGDTYTVVELDGGLATVKVGEGPKFALGPQRKGEGLDVFLAEVTKGRSSEPEGIVQIGRLHLEQDVGTTTGTPRAPFLVTWKHTTHKGSPPESGDPEPERCCMSCGSASVCGIGVAGPCGSCGALGKGSAATR